MAPRKKRTNRELFLAKLSTLSNNGERLVSNANLMAGLGWDEAKYLRIKSELLNEGVITKGGGRGGSVGMVSIDDEAVDLFVSYSHVDESLKDMLLKHLEPLKRMKLINAWHDRDVLAGQEFDSEIKKNLEKSKIILLLISIDFINSDYCFDVELERALELHAENKAVVVPIILRECLWKHTPFSKIMALPRDGVAVTAYSDQDKAFLMVAEGIVEIVKNLNSKR